MTAPRPCRCPRCDCRWTISAAVNHLVCRQCKNGRHRVPHA